MVIGGKYALTRLLAHGGISSVFEAQHVSLGRRVAIKVLQPGHAAQPEIVTRLKQEARAASGFEHPNIVEIYDFGQDAVAGSFFIVQKLLQGLDLRDHLDLRQRLPLHEALDLLVPIMGALTAAHRRGVVHRDIKPENIFLARTPGGVVVPTLIDFGIAKQLDILDQTAVTQLGAILGTVQYMSPEQARGEAVDARTDVWALAVVLFELLTGRCPFDGPNVIAVVMRIISERPADLGSLVALPTELAAIVRRALEPNLALRYPTMAGFLRDVLAWDPSLRERHRGSFEELDAGEPSEEIIHVEIEPTSLVPAAYSSTRSQQPSSGEGFDDELLDATELGRIPDALALGFARTAALPAASAAYLPRRRVTERPDPFDEPPADAALHASRTRTLSPPLAHRAAPEPQPETLDASSAEESVPSISVAPFSEPEPDSSPGSSPPTMREDLPGTILTGVPFRTAGPSDARDAANDGAEAHAARTEGERPEPSEPLERRARATEPSPAPAPGATRAATLGPWNSAGAAAAEESPETVGAATARAIDAFNVNALDETIALARAASQHPDATEETAGRMRVIECMARLWLGDVEPADVVAREALWLLPAGSAPWFSALGHAAIASGYLGRRETLLELRESHAKVSELQRRTPGFVTAGCRLAIHLLRAGETERAQEAFSEAQAAAQWVEESSVVDAWIALTQAELAAHDGDLTTSLRLLEAAVERFSEAGDARNACRQRAAVGRLYLQLGAYASAEAVLGQAVDAAEAMRLYFAPSVRWQLGWALARTDRLAEALAHFERGVEGLVAQRNPRAEALARAYHARALAMGGDVIAAVREADRVLAMEAAAPGCRPLVMAVLAEAAARRGENPAAIELCRRAVGALDALPGSVEGEAFVRLALFQALRRAGAEVEAQRVLAQARARLAAAAERIGEEALRSSFLEQVPEHATLRKQI
jgi:serine/threonine-protein kinase